jgi:hypothetical protein
MRRIALDERARVPFAVLAVMIFLLSSFSVAYIGATTRQELLNTLLRSDMILLNEIGVRLQDELDSEVQLIGAKTVHWFLEKVNSPSKMAQSIDQGLVNRTFQELLEDHMQRKFPSEVSGYRVEETGYRINLMPNIERTIDLVPSDVRPLSNGGVFETSNHSKIDTTRSQEYGPKNMTHTYLAVGHVNVSIQDERSSLKQHMNLWINREIEIPLPLLLSKMESFQSSSLGSSSEIARITKYILTTIAQFKAFQGQGMSRSNLPSDLQKVILIDDGSATEVLTVKDVELAVNLALLLEYGKTFRTWDPEAANAIHNQTRILAQSSQQTAPVDSLMNLLNEYSYGGSIDAADLVCLYLGLGAENGQGVNIEAILAQALYGVFDQFILKYLDYTGIMPLVDSVWKGVQVVDGILQQAGEAIEDVWDWFTGKTADSWYEVLEDWLEKSMVQDGGLESEYFLRLLVENREDSAYDSFEGEIIGSYPSVDTHENGFNLRFVVMLTDEYHTWYSNGSGQAHRFRHSDDEAIAGHDYIKYTIAASFNSPDHQIAFSEVNVADGMSGSEVWLEFYKEYFARDDESSAPETLRESIKEIVKGIAEDAVRRVSSIINKRRDGFGVVPSDDIPFLGNLKDWTLSVVDEVINFYKSPEGMEEVKKILASHSKEDIGLLEDLKYHLWERYDEFVDYQSLLPSTIESVALGLLENHMSFEVTDEKTIENADTPFDWTFEGNLTADLLPSVEIAAVFLNGGVDSQEQFTILKNALLDDVDLAYQKMKSREVGVGTIEEEKGVLVQAIEAAEEASQDILPAIIGGALDVMDGVGLLDMALETVSVFLEGMVDGAEASNVQYVLPYMFEEPLEFWEGGYDVAPENGITEELRFTVDQMQDYIPARWSNVNPVSTPPVGLLHIDFNHKGAEDGDIGYDSGDIKGKHYTDVLSVTRRPYETRWNISVLGQVPLHVGIRDRGFLGPEGYRPIHLNRSIEVNFSTTVVIYTGWGLDGVDYDVTNTLLTDVIDFMDVAWDTIKAPLMDLIDYLQIASDFLRDAFRLLLEFGSQALAVISDATDLAISLLQSFVSDVLSFVSDHLTGFLKDFGLEHFFIEFAGLSFEMKLPKGKEREDYQCTMWARVRGGVLGQDLDFTTYLIEFDEPVENMEMYILTEGELRFGSRGLANFSVDPFMMLREFILEIHAIDLDSDGDGWALDIVAPEVDIYRTSETSLSEIIGFVPSISLPMFGVEVGVDVGISIKHMSTHPRFPLMNLKLVIYEMLKESLLEAWSGIELPPTLDSLEEFVRSATEGFIERLTERFEDSVLEVVLYLDLSVSALGSGGSVGGGLRLGLVVDRAVLFSLMHWVMDAVSTLIRNLLRPFDPSAFAEIPDNLPEYLGVRFEVYFGMGHPKMLRRLVSSQSQKRMDVAISVQPNAPAIAVLAGLDWGKWRMDFGVYLENFPLSSLGKIETMNQDSIVDLYVLKGQIQEVCGSCR